ncbi:DUF3558 domain-containing protein [Nocardia nova]|uniref:DUF3558 domain-containing protein n=1 Tax=Nocardia nova TaxID=37330 RepID=UPI0033D96F85
MKRYAVVAAVCIAGAFSAAGCSTETNGTPTATADPAAALWDPCTQVPDSALTAAGLDPSTKESGVGGVEQHGWKICGWNSSPKKFAITVYSTARPPAEIANKSGNIEQRDVTIAGRSGTEFKASGWDTQCNAVFPAQQGAIQLQVLGRLAEDNPINPCETLASVGNSIVPTFPK